MAETGEELGLDGTVDRVIDTLVNAGFYPTIAVAEFANLGDFPGLVVADCEACEVALFVG